MCSTLQHLVILGSAERRSHSTALYFTTSTKLSQNPGASSFAFSWEQIILLDFPRGTQPPCQPMARLPDTITAEAINNSPARLFKFAAGCRGKNKYMNKIHQIPAYISHFSGSYRLRLVSATHPTQELNCLLASISVFLIQHRLSLLALLAQFRHSAFS